MYDWAEYRHFRYLLEILDLKGFRAAAEQLHTTQPNLSAHAKQFRENSGLHLYRKSKSGRISLTPDGVAFKLIARGLLSARDEAMAALLAVEQGEVRTLRLGCSSQADPTLFNAFFAMHRELLPDCPIRPVHGDTAQLVEEIASGEIDVAIVTLPVGDLSLRVDEIGEIVLWSASVPTILSRRRRRSSQPTLQQHPTVLYHPQRNAQAHARLLELLEEVGVKIEEYSRASHPTEMQGLVKQGFGFALIREGTVLDVELTTRPVAGVDWTVDTAFVYKKQGHPKTVPMLIRLLKGRLSPQTPKGKKPPLSAGKGPEQMSLLG